MNKKFALLLLIPLLAFLLVPVATVKATAPGITLLVYCDGEAQKASTSITFAGHSISVGCPVYWGENGDSTCIPATTGKFTATTTIGGIKQVTKGVFGSNEGAIGGHQYGSFSYYPDVSYADWVIGSPCIG
jgi:hypothetical protein